MALYSSQVLGSAVAPILSIAFLDAYSVLMRKTCSGNAIQLPFGLWIFARSAETSFSKPASATRLSKLTVGASADHALISGPFNCETAGGRPAMRSARSLFSKSVNGPETGLCSHLAPALVTSSPNAFIAAPSLPADHWEMALTRGSADDAVAIREKMAAAKPVFETIVILPRKLLRCPAV